MKKTLSLIMAVLFVMSCLNVVVFADDAHAVAVIDSKTEVTIGEEFDVYVTLEDYANIKSIALKIGYDSTVLEQTTEAEEALLVTEGVLMSDYDGVSAVYASSSTLDAGIAAVDGKVLKLSFKAIATGNASITCEVTEEKVSGAKDTYDATSFEAGVGCLHENYTSEVTTPASCKATGVITYTCDGCGHTYTEEIALADHTWGEVTVKVEPTCTTDGEQSATCEVCGVSDAAIVIPATGHTFDEGVVTKEATCKEAGEKTFTCEVCGETVTEAVAKLAHTYSDAVVVEPTCTEAGSKTYTCTACGEKVTETLKAPGHTFGEWEVVEEATEDEEGLEQRTCSVCGAKETREIEKVEKADDNKWSYLVQSIRRHALRQQKANKDNVKVEVEEVEEEPEVIDEAIVEEAWVNPFVDIFESDSYYAAIEFVYENGLFKGVSEIEFAPETTMTRAMFVTVLGRIHGITEDYVGENTFADVVEGEWYAPYVVWAADNGIVLGYGDGFFGINDEITVEQAAVILARYAAFIELDVVAEYDLAAEYADAADVAEWAAEAMAWAVSEGIYTGVEGYLVPQAPAARALVATMLYNFAN